MFGPSTLAAWSFAAPYFVSFAALCFGTFPAPYFGTFAVRTFAAPQNLMGWGGLQCFWIWSWTRRLTRWSMGWPTWCGTWGFRWLALWWMVVEVDKLADNGIVMLLDMEVDKLAQEVAVIWWARGVLLPLMLIHYSDSNDCLGDVGGWAACFGGVLSARRGQEGCRRGRRRWELLLWGGNLVKMLLQDQFWI